MAVFEPASFLLVLHISASQAASSGGPTECSRLFIRYHEQVSYNKAALDQEFWRAQRATNGWEEPVHLDFQAYQRTFKLSLKHDNSIFSKDFQLNGMRHTDSFNVSFFYSGKLRDEPGSSCHGSIIDGLFEGIIHTKDGTYYVELARASSGNETRPSLPIIYHQREIDYTLLNNTNCPSLALKMHPFWHLQPPELKLKEEKTSPRQRRSLDYSRTSCLMHFKADFLFYRRFGSLESVVAQIASYVKAVNAIYERADFGGIKYIDFKVKSLHVVQEDDPTSSMYSRFIGPEKLLMLHARSNWDGYCLSYLLTDRDYSGILGIAFNGQAGDLGGICSKHRKFQGTLRSLNTGLITIQKYGHYLPPRIVHIALAHELGHSLGAPHDESQQCAPFSMDTTHGNFLMFDYATDGDQPNNDRFSPCSTAFIRKTLRAKKDQCFVESDRPICGNQVLDPGEECDSGSEPKDPCCYAANETEGLRCQLKGGAQCSPSQGPCCGPDCKYFSWGKLCQAETECLLGSTCLGNAAHCPAPVPKANFTPCLSGAQICLDGSCRGSLCLSHHLEPCECVSSSPWEQCHLCCQKPGRPNTCASTTSSLLKAEFNGTRLPLSPGTPCKGHRGYCDKFHICRLVDEDGPMARVKNAIVGFIELEDMSAWMKTRWWAILLAILTVAAMMSFTVFFFERTEDSKQGIKMTSGAMGLDRPQPHLTVTHWEWSEFYVETTCLEETRIEKVTVGH
ncbi:disintegrin and metalloproteinase domain-containing protein 10-like [Gracilinanus agilis]|uniref:disintegrin and metalloproteinase domain-containing protein 10-like n=1 Tax=Gracilinanus agilis TaxID=191870 RepID=UPI001CFEE93B|nr:disintegrin and metalloproteinase domain-containing protein 10-like [Gracilinanus agilis]